MATRQYIGARYVPKFDGAWDNTKEYDPLIIVSYQGNSYTSRTFVPANIDITNETYWALTGNYNAQVEAYRQEVYNLSADLALLSNYVTPEMFGAIGDGIRDDTQALKDAAASGKALLLTGIYAVTDTIDFTETTIMLDNSSIKALSALQYVVTLCYDEQNTNRRFKINVNSNGIADTGIGVGYCKGCILDLSVINSNTTGIELGHRQSGNNENVFLKLSVYGKADGTSAIGIKCNCADNTIGLIATSNVETGVLVTSGELICDSLHSWLTNDARSNYWTNSCCLKVTGVFYAYVNWLYQDGTRYGVSTDNGIIHINVLQDATDVTHPVDEPIINCIHTDNTKIGTCVLHSVRKYDSNTYASFSGFGNNCIYGQLSDDYISYDGSIADTVNSLPFNDADNAPSIGSYFVPYDMANLPVQQNGILKTEINGTRIVQTFIPDGQYNSNVYFRVRTIGVGATWRTWLVIGASVVE